MICNERKVFIVISCLAHSIRMKIFLGQYVLIVHLLFIWLLYNADMNY